MAHVLYPIFLKIDVDNVAEPDLEASDISETIKFF